MSSYRSGGRVGVPALVIDEIGRVGRGDQRDASTVGDDGGSSRDSEEAVIDGPTAIEGYDCDHADSGGRRCSSQDECLSMTVCELIDARLRIEACLETYEEPVDDDSSQHTAVTSVDEVCEYHGIQYAAGGSCTGCDELEAEVRRSFDEGRHWSQGQDEKYDLSYRYQRYLFV
jgi:hypothetical protein